MSLLCYDENSTTSLDSETVFASCGLVSSLSAHAFSSLPLDSYTRASDNCFEINVLQGIDCVGLTLLSRSELHIYPHLLEDSVCSYVLQTSSNGNRANLMHNGKVISVIPWSSSDLAQAVNILYCPSQSTATFTMNQSETKWSHTFEGMPSSNVFLFAKLRGEVEHAKKIKWNAVTDVHHNASSIK